MQPLKDVEESARTGAVVAVDGNLLALVAIPFGEISLGEVVVVTFGLGCNFYIVTAKLQSVFPFEAGKAETGEPHLLALLAQVLEQRNP